MFKCNTKKHNFYAAVCGGITAVMVFVSLMLHIISGIILTNTKAIEFLDGIKYIFDIIIPVLLIGILFLLFTNAGERKFTNKWWIPVGVIFYILGINSVSSFIRTVEYSLLYEEFHFIRSISYVFNIAGFTLLILGLFEKKFWKIVPIGFGAICVSDIIILFADSIAITELVPIITLLLLLGLSLGVGNKILRTLAVIFTIISVFVRENSMIENIAYIILAFLIVPSRKVKFDFNFIPGILFLLMSIGAFSGFESVDGFSQLLVLLLFIISPLILAMYFFFKEFQKFTVVGYALMFICLIIAEFYNLGIAVFDELQFNLTPLVIVKVIAFLLFGSILFDRENPKNKIYKIVLIVSSIVMLVLVPIVIEEFYYYREYMINEIQLTRNVLFAIAMIVSALVLVPFKFTKYQGLGKHIFLSIFTLGIWYLIWIYNVTKNLGIVDKDKKFKYIKELLLYIFIPFYYVYWNYKAAYAVDTYAECHGIKSNQATMVFILSLVSPLISSIIIQSKFNAVELKQ